MTPTKWDKVKAIFGVKSAERFGQAGPAIKREQAVGSQSETQTVDPMASGKSTVDCLGPPIIPALHGPLPRKASHSLAFGQIVAGRFEILRFINSGGMGEVYEAWDSELRERIALKTIRPEIASSPSAIERFKREVKQTRVISQHNVCRVYEVFSHTQDSGDRLWFLTMELLEGLTLSERLRGQGVVPEEKALDLVEQMVAGLAAAHDHGIVHRDFKSSNVMLVDAGTSRTRVVITDFGLALNLLTEHYGSLETSGGGTPQYMAPEQERDGQVGLAADQYALGVVMCEMLTGRRPSRPDNTGRVHLPPGRFSLQWEEVIRRCLQFRPEDRFTDVSDVITTLKPRRRTRLSWIIGVWVTLALILGGVAFAMLGRGGMRVEGVSQLTPDTDLTSRPSLSRDGQLVAYSSNRAEAGNLDIWVQRLPSGRPIRLTNDPAQDVDPNLAPDGSSVVFRSERNGGGIYITQVTGTGERLLARDGRNPRFSPDGDSVVFWVGDPDETVGSGKLYLLSLADNSLVRLAADFRDARLPVWSPDGRYVLFTGCRTGDQPLPACAEWWVISRDGTTLQSTGSLALLRRENIQPMDEIGGWYRDKVLFSGRRGTATSLWELAIPRRSLKGEGKPIQLTSGDAREVAPSLADNDTIAFEHLSGALHIWRIEHATNQKLVVLTKLTQDAAVDICPSISSDGHWLVFSRGIASPRDIWTKDLNSGGESLFLASSQDKLSPIIDDSGRTVVFEERDSGIPSVFVATRGKSVRRLCTGCSNPTGWFDEDRSVFYREGLPSKIKMIDLMTGQANIALEADGTALDGATWSPKSQHLLFTASRAGNAKQIFAVSFPKSAQSPTGEWIPITGESEFGDRPQWSSDGKTVFYLSSRDGFSCVWGRHFDPESGRATSAPFPVMHFHNPRFSPDVVVNRSFNLSVSGDSVYLNVGEINTSIWTGVLKRRSLLSVLSRPR